MLLLTLFHTQKTWLRKARDLSKAPRVSKWQNLDSNIAWYSSKAMFFQDIPKRNMPQSLYALQGHPLFFFKTKRQNSDNKQLYTFIEKKKKASCNPNKQTHKKSQMKARASGSWPLPAEESTEILLGSDGPVFFFFSSCFGKRLGCQALIQNRSAFRSILW